MVTTKQLKKGYRCPGCKKVNKFSVWVFAHWNIPITHSCDCGRKNTLQQGKLVKE